MQLVLWQPRVHFVNDVLDRHSGTSVSSSNNSSSDSLNSLPQNSDDDDDDDDDIATSQQQQQQYVTSLMTTTADDDDMDLWQLQTAMQSPTRINAVYSVCYVDE